MKKKINVLTVFLISHQQDIPVIVTRQKLIKLLFVFLSFLEILTNVLMVLFNNSFKESFYEKKKIINILTAFLISDKRSVKTFLK